MFTPPMGVELASHSPLPTFWTVAQVYRRPKPAEAPKNYPAGRWPLWFVGYAFWHNRRFGLLFLLGLIGDVILHLVFKF